MTTSQSQMLFYESVVPLSSETHRDLSLEVGRDYGFSSKTNSVPLTAVEFAQAAAEYPIVFASSADGVMPAVLLGLRADENLFLAASTWKAQYKPAFVRRYPFVFASGGDGQTLTLCIDEAFNGFNRESRGEALFTSSGQPTAYTNDILKFLQDYQLHFQLTQAFCKKLQELGLLEPMQANVAMNSGERLSLGGFQVVSRVKLKELSSETLTDLVKNDGLELLYLHLFSLRNFTSLQERLAGSLSSAKTENAL